MEAEIIIREKEEVHDGMQFAVEVKDDVGESVHEVVLDDDYWHEFAGEHESQEQFITECFQFLLEREPRTSILLGFNVQDISRYFPEFEEVMGG